MGHHSLLIIGSNIFSFAYSSDDSKSSGELITKVYTSGWVGGSRAGITTYNMVKWGKGISNGAVGVSLVLGGIDTYQGFQQDGGKIGYNTTVAATTTVGGIGGAWAGAEALGAVGTMICPGWGTLAGGVIGGVAGGFGGSAFTEWIVNEFW